MWDIKEVKELIVTLDTEEEANKAAGVELLKSIENVSGIKNYDIDSNLIFSALSNKEKAKIGNKTYIVIDQSYEKQEISLQEVSILGNPIGEIYYAYRWQLFFLTVFRLAYETSVLLSSSFIHMFRPRKKGAQKV